MSSDQFLEEDKVQSSISYYELMKKLWPYCQRHLGLLTLAVASVFALALFGRALPFLIGHAVDEGFQKGNAELVKIIILLFLALEIAKTLTQFVCTYSFQKFGNRILFYVREDLMKHVQSLPTQYFNKTPVGRLVTRLTNDVANLGELFNEGLVSVAIELVTIASLVIAMAIISPSLSLYTLILTPFFVWLSFVISEKIREILREAKKKLSELNSYVAETLSGIKVVQLFNQTPRSQKNFSVFSREYRDLSLHSIKYYALMQPVMNLFNAVTVTAALYFGGIFVFDNAIQLGAMITFILLAQDFIQPLREILEKYQQFQNSLTSAERVFQLLEEKQEQDAPLQSNQNEKTSVMAGDILFKNLHFSYEPSLPPVLANINLHFTPGQSIALVGRTGSGKTTLISLLQRLYRVPDGKIFVDGREINDYRLEDLRKKIGVVQQDNFIFRTTLRENIRLADSAVSDQKIIQVCQMIGYWNLLQKNQRDLDFFIEERGSNLSVGERQLIAFARILIFNPEVLILDEATANVDSETEALIQKATEEVIRGRTAIIIAHRLSTIKNCDHVVVLGGGEVLEEGPPDVLLAQKGAFHQLAEAGVKSTNILSSAPGTDSP